MVTKIRRRLTFSNILAVIAVFVALGATAYAAHKISGKSIKPNSEPGNRLKDNSVTGSKINLGTLGTVPSASTAKNVFGVTVTSAGNPQTTTLPGTTVNKLSGQGDYKVTFPRSVQACVPNATLQSIGGGVSAIAAAFGANTVEVITSNSGGVPTDAPFNLSVTC
jgi:hypothetical protein